MLGRTEWQSDDQYTASYVAKSGGLTYFPRLELDHHDGLIQASDLHLACVPALILVVRAVGSQGLPVKN